MSAQPPRGLHFVGTLPQFTSTEAAIAWQLDTVPDRLCAVASGEVDKPNWIVELLTRMSAMPSTRVTRYGRWSSYEDPQRLAVRRGHDLRGADIPFRIARDAIADVATLLRAAEARSRPAPPLQVGIPGALDVALFAFGPRAALRYASVVRDGLSGEIERIHARAGDRVVFQLEIPAELVALTATPSPLRPALAALLARHLLRQVAAAPVGSRWGVHLCLGDLGHRALGVLHTCAPLVSLANAIAHWWPAGRTLEFLHLPVAGGDRLPVTEPHFYRPLARLHVPDAVRIVAGVAHEDQGLDRQLRALGLIEDMLGRSVVIATPCGLGRRDPERARAATDRMHELAESAPQHAKAAR